jgi:hypothetical protein
MDVNRVVPLDVAHQVEIPLERDVGIVAALEQNLHPANRLALVDLGSDLFEAQNVPLEIPGPAVKRAELAIGDADVGVVDVPVDDIGDHVLRVLAPPLGVGQLPELQETGSLIELQIALELTRDALYNTHVCNPLDPLLRLFLQAAEMNESDPSGTSPSWASRRKKSVRPARCR